ncbi:MAG TPA: hypothetical protein VNA25_21125 [Phycisphaerae bacterium]|nr:hypothetical protein [Phycisphaerae bacterium]
MRLRLLLPILLCVCLSFPALAQQVEQPSPSQTEVKPGGRSEPELLPHPWWNLTEEQAKAYVEQGRQIFKEGKLVPVIGIGTEDDPVCRFSGETPVELVSVRLMTPEFILLMQGYEDETIKSTSDHRQQLALRIASESRHMAWPECSRAIGISYVIRPMGRHSGVNTSLSLQTDAGFWCGRDTEEPAVSTVTVYAGKRQIVPAKNRVSFSLKTPDGRLAVNQSTRWVKLLINCQGDERAIKFWIDGSNRVELEGTEE